MSSRSFFWTYITVSTVWIANSPLTWFEWNIKGPTLLADILLWVYSKQETKELIQWRPSDIAKKDICFIDMGRLGTICMERLIFFRWFATGFPNKIYLFFYEIGLKRISRSKYTILYYTRILGCSYMFKWNFRSD